MAPSGRRKVAASFFRVGTANGDQVPDRYKHLEWTQPAATCTLVTAGSVDMVKTLRRKAAAAARPGPARHFLLSRPAGGNNRTKMLVCRSLPQSPSSLQQKQGDVKAVMCHGFQAVQ